MDEMAGTAILRHSQALRQRSRHLQDAVDAAAHAARLICAEATDLRSQAAQDRHARQCSEPHQEADTD